MSVEQVPFSTTMSSKTKKLLERFCKARGIKMNHFVEQAVLEKLEDEMDSELVRSREFEATKSWEPKAS